MSIGEKFEILADAVYEKGEYDEWSKFWDAYQNKGNQVDCTYAFYGGLWTDTTYNPKYTIVTNWSANNMFEKTAITDTKVDIDISRASQAFYIFRNANKLKTVRKLIVSESTPFITSGQGSFDGCTSLEEIWFEGIIDKPIKFSDCPLKALSILNIIDHLKDNSKTGMTRTLTLGETNLLKLTNEQKAQATEKGWSLA